MGEIPTGVHKVLASPRNAQCPFFVDKLVVLREDVDALVIVDANGRDTQRLTSVHWRSEGDDRVDLRGWYVGPHCPFEGKAPGLWAWLRARTQQRTRLSRISALI